MFSCFGMVAVMIFLSEGRSLKRCHNPLVVVDCVRIDVANTSHGPQCAVAKLVRQF